METLYSLAEMAPESLSGVVSLSFILGALVTYLWCAWRNAKNSKGWQHERNYGYNARIQQQRKRVKTYPGYPNGWYKVANVWEMKPGEIRSLTMCGKDIVVYKPEKPKKATDTWDSNQVFVIDAYCPHLGAHFGDGKVCGDCIECPFHGWLFNGEGQCTTIPYSPVPPPKEAATKNRWQTRTITGMLLVWYDPDGLGPAWEPANYVELNDRKKWRYIGEESGRVSMHVQDFAENGADYAHFPKLHSTVLKLPFLGEVLGVKHNTTWEVVQEKPHQGLFKDYVLLTFRGKVIPGTGVMATITMDGGGATIHFQFSTPAGNLHIIQTSTPLAPCLNEYTMQMFAETRMTRFMAWYLCWNWKRESKNDFLVWENKEYTAKPVLVKGDGPIMTMRRWYLQFYSDNATYGDETW